MRHFQSDTPPALAIYARTDISKLIFAALSFTSAILAPDIRFVIVKAVAGRPPLIKRGQSAHACSAADYLTEGHSPLEAIICAVPDCKP